MIMKVYWTDKFVGHYPIGTCAIVVASTPEDAARMLNEKLKTAGLLLKGDRPVDAIDMQHVNTREPSVNIVKDGNY